DLHRAGELLDEDLADLPVDGVVVLPAQQVVVGTGNARGVRVEHRPWLQGDPLQITTRFACRHAYPMLSRHHPPGKRIGHWYEIMDSRGVLVMVCRGSSIGWSLT